MICVEVWRDADARWIAARRLGLQGEASRVTRVEQWHSDACDANAPFREWRAFDHGRLMLAWRIHEDPPCPTPAGRNPGAA